MKRLSFIIALALVLTIGGVYATFNYANGNDTVQAVEITNMSKKLADADTTSYGDKGTLTVTQSYAVNVDDVNKNLTTVGTVAEANKTMTITFTPATDCATDVRAYGIDLKLTFTNAEYKDSKGTFQGTIFTIKVPNVEAGKPTPTIENGVIHLPKEMGVKQPNGDFVFTMNLTNYIEITEILLPTYADYEKYAAAFAFEFKVTIEEDK